ncbi:MAG: nucleotidyltransferase domain-containing protein [Clostridiales Family XIII bacterium]|jgi:predicted nucleotidyltransferase|nr:nucleotidyltransferase domain-containing protein [Clostridiales Family XIII bacterium]
MLDYVERELDAIRDSIAQVSEVRSAYLFGSCAKGEIDADSDIDIYVVVADSAIDTIAVGAQIRKALYKKRKIPLDLLVGRESVFNSRKKQATLESIVAKEGVLLYGS